MVACSAHFTTQSAIHGPQHGRSEAVPVCRSAVAILMNILTSTIAMAGLQSEASQVELRERMVRLKDQFLVCGVSVFASCPIEIIGYSWLSRPEATASRYK